VVIGSNCFTGSHIVDTLLAEYPDASVFGISRSPEYKPLFLPYKQRSTASFRFCQIDIVRSFNLMVKLLEELRPNVVINVAALSEVALSNERPVEYFEINTLAVVNLSNYLRTCSYLERYVHISSAEIFGSCTAPVTEDARVNPSTPYAVSKAAADMYINTLIQNCGFPATLIRSTNVYGKHQQIFKIIPRTVIYLKLGKIIELHGGGRAIKSFTHVRDVARGLLWTLDKGKPGTYHFSVPDDLTVADVVQKICTSMGYDFQACTRIVDERLGQDARYWLECSKSNRELDWHPRVQLENGVQEVVDWINDNWDEIRTQPLEYQHRL
jgi:dTDP-glucose 4,6-dehydratase